MLYMKYYIQRFEFGALKLNYQMRPILLSYLLVVCTKYTGALLAEEAAGPYSGRMSRLHYVFVYGTLKRGEPNHNWFLKDGGYFKFVSEAKTVEKYPLIIGTKYNIPFLLYSPGNGTNVKGELYEVDDKVFANLDILEDHPNFYIREEREVQCLEDKKVTAWIYFIKKFKSELLNQTTFESYSSEGPHGLKYVSRYLRSDASNYKSDILDTVKN